MKHIRSQIFTALCAVLFSTSSFSDTLIGDFRHRPPEMVVDLDNYQLSGSLKDVIEQAAAKLGHTIEWRVVPFIRSLDNLKNHKTDIVPRVVHTLERTEFIEYLGPIGIERYDIHFVTQLNGPKIADYQDLRTLQIGMKRGTAYFVRFDNDTELRKTAVADDFNLARMLRAGRIDAVIVLDLPALIAELQAIEFKDYQFADYVYPNPIGNYYGMPLNHPQAPAFNQALTEMRQDGTITNIYRKYGLSLLE